MNAINVSGTCGDQFIPIELIDGGVETVIRPVHVDRFADLGGMPHHFFRYAAHVNAGAAQFFGFNQCAFLAVHCCTVNGGNTAAAAANSDVIIVLGHDRSFMFIVGRRSVTPSAKIFAIVYLILKGSTDGCDYSGTIQLTEV